MMSGLGGAVASGVGAGVGMGIGRAAFNSVMGCGSSGYSEAPQQQQVAPVQDYQQQPMQ